jgi:hypothetical protein
MVNVAIARLIVLKTMGKMEIALFLNQIANNYLNDACSTKLSFDPFFGSMVRALGHPF